MEHVLSIAWEGRRSQESVAEKRLRFGEIARLHQATLLRVASGYCKGNQSLAQDLVQDAFVNGYRAFLEGSFQEGTNAKAWLIRILTNLFLNDYRRRRKWSASQDIEEGADLPASEESRPDRALLERILDGPIEAALGRLPEPQRMCVTLVDIEGLDYAEAATILECPIGTIRSRLARGRVALYEDLVEYGRERGLVQ